KAIPIVRCTMSIDLLIDLRRSPLAPGRLPLSRVNQRWVRRTRLVVTAMIVACVTSRAHTQGARQRAAARTRITEPAGERVVLDELIAAAVQRSPGLAIARADREEAHARDAAADAIDEWRI